MCQLAPSLKLPRSQNLQYLGYDMPLNLYVTHKMPVWCAFYWNSSGSLVCLDNKECHSLYLNVRIHYKPRSPLKYLTSWIYLVNRACSWSLIVHYQESSTVCSCFFLCYEWNGMGFPCSFHNQWRQQTVFSERNFSLSRLPTNWLTKFLDSVWQLLRRSLNKYC